MGLNSRSISNGFKGQLDRWKTAKISTADITEKITNKLSSADLAEKITSRISTADITERVKKFSSSDFTEKVKKGVDQISECAKTVVEKVPTEKLTTKGVVNLNRNGYEVYNIDDSNEVYVAQVSETAIFDEDENYTIYRAKPGEFTGDTEKEVVEIVPVAETAEETDSEKLFTHVDRGLSREIEAKVARCTNGVMEDCSGFEADIVGGYFENIDDDCGDVVIIPMVDDSCEIPCDPVPPVIEKVAVDDAPMIAGLPKTDGFDVEPLTTETIEDNEMLPPADRFINMMSESAVTSSAVEPLKCNPLADDSYSKEALTPVKEQKVAAKRFVFKDGKLQILSQEEDSSAFTVNNRAVCIDDEVSGVMKLTVPELESYDDSSADAPYQQIPDDGMEAIPFPFAESAKKAENHGEDFHYGKVKFEFENRNTEYESVGFSF